MNKWFCLNKLVEPNPWNRFFGETEPVEPNRLFNNRLWTEPCIRTGKLEPNRTESNRYHAVIIKQNRGQRQVRPSCSCWEPLSQHPERSPASTSWQCQAWGYITKVGIVPLWMMENYIEKTGTGMLDQFCWVSFCFERKNERAHIHDQEKIDIQSHVGAWLSL